MLRIICLCIKYPAGLYKPEDSHAFHDLLEKVENNCGGWSIFFLVGELLFPLQACQAKRCSDGEGYESCTLRTTLLLLFFFFCGTCKIRCGLFARKEVGEIKSNFCLAKHFTQNKSC